VSHPSRRLVGNRRQIAPSFLAVESKIAVGSPRQLEKRRRFPPSFPAVGVVSDYVFRLSENAGNAEFILDRGLT
jgi:hypothetical protein